MIPTQAQLNRAVFLDRDGVINISDVVDGKPYAPRELEDFVLYDGVIDAVDCLKQAGYLVIVVTNQPDVGNGKVRKEIIEQMHDKLRKLILQLMQLLFNLIACRLRNVVFIKHEIIVIPLLEELL